MLIEKPFSDFILPALIAGLLGAVVMEIVMWLIARKGWAKGNMIIALGSLVTRQRDNALGTGLLIHAIAAFGFALLYTYSITQLGLASWPTAFFTGIGFGILHGMVVTLMLVWVVADQHPLAEFKEADLAIGVTHLAGHIAYGATVGLIIALASL